MQLEVSLTRKCFSLLLFVGAVNAISHEPETLWTTSPTSLCLINQNITEFGFVPSGNLSCRADAMGLCRPYFLKGLNCSFSSPELVTCLNDNYFELSAECQSFLPCGAHIDEHCGGILGGENLIMSCLVDAAKNVSNPLSDQCLKHSACLDPSNDDVCDKYPYESSPPQEAETSRFDKSETSQRSPQHKDHVHRIVDPTSSKPAQLDAEPQDASSKSENIEVTKTGGSTRHAVASLDVAVVCTALALVFSQAFNFRLWCQD